MDKITLILFGRMNKAGRKILQFQNRIHSLKRKCNTFRTIIKSNEEDIGILVGVIDQQNEEIENRKKNYRELSQTYKQVTSSDVELIESLRTQINQMRCCGNCDFGKGIMCSNDRRCMGDFENWVLRTED